MFDVGYREIASVIERSEAACRQVVHRARERVRGDRKRFDVTESVKVALLETSQEPLSSPKGPSTQQVDERND